MFNYSVEHDCCVPAIRDLFNGIEYNGKPQHTDVVNQVTREVIGSSKFRNGSMPSEEVVGTIRRVVEDAINDDRPVPVLVPWGASKQGTHGCDLAEVAALMQLRCLNERVKRYYAPGVEIRIRLEDAVDQVLFDQEWYVNKTQPYCARFIMLCSILMPEAIVIRESDLVDFNSSEWYRLQGILLKAIKTGDVHMLSGIGWTNNMPLEQIAHYRRVYDNYYPSLTRDQRDELISNYFACALIRNLQRGSGEAIVNDYLVPAVNLNFSGRVPGIDPRRRVYYLCNVRQHTNRAPWIGKGYVDTPRGITYVGNWNEDYHERNRLTVSNDHFSVELEADYVQV